MQTNKFLRVAEWGFSVFPVIADGKKPATANGFKDASRDEAQLAQWGETHAHCNVGIATGKPSGIWVLDIDIKNGHSGIKSLVKLKKAHGELPDTLSAETPSGGYHFYFRYPENTEIKSRVALADGIDVRAAGGYVVAPPSKVDGNPYMWVDKNTPIADAPDWLVNLVASPPTSNRRVIRLGDKVDKGGRNNFLMRMGFKFVKQGNAAERLPDHLQQLNENQCEPPLPQAEVEEIAANIARLHVESDHDEIRFSDLGNARRLTALLGDTLRYFSPEQQWFQLTPEGRWQRVDDLIVARGARTMIEQMHMEVARLSDGPYKQAMKKHAMRSESAKAINDAITLFRSEPDILVEVSALDRGEWLFPVENGIVNLQDGNFQPTDPNLMITQTAGVRFDPDATCPTWEAFIDQTMGGDKELVAYIKRAVGYSLTTTTREHAMFFVYGTGANGKSTFLNIMRALFGELGAQASGDLLLERFGKGNTGAPSSDLARLRGKRLVAMSEVEDGQHFSDKTVKSYTGGDAITARYLYKDTFEFVPRFKIWLASNYKPTVKGTDTGVWRRMKLIPFTVTVPPEQRDKRLEEKLRAELPGILNWAVEGCIEWQRVGLNDPKVISDAVKEYRDDMDVVGTWLRDHCVFEPDAKMHFGNAYKFFKEWSEENYNFAYAKKRFGQHLGATPGLTAISTPARYYKGVRLNGEVILDEKTEKFLRFSPWVDLMWAKGRHSADDECPDSV